MKKVYFLLLLCLSFISSADVQTAGFMNTIKEEAKKLGPEEIKKCMLMSEKERQLWAANYTGRAEELNFVVKLLEKDVKKAYEEKNNSAAKQGEKTTDLLIKRTVVYLYFNGIYRDNCSSEGIDELFDNMIFE